ncbi:MAG: hypothetical protein R2761_12525 [Acidimicrobiales bacterium]
MERPGKFENARYVGDKRTQVVYDVDGLGAEDAALIDELMAAGTYLCFAPDTLAEARNRGYRLYRGQRAGTARQAAAS